MTTTAPPPRRPRPPLPTLLSQALVAWTIELDNEAEHRLRHRTTRGPEEDKGPWLVSYPLWANVLQYVEPQGTSMADLTARARTSRLLLGGLRRWGYVRLEPPAGETLQNPPQPAALVRPTRHARAASEVWPSLPGLIDSRWRARFGDEAVDGLSAALATIYDDLDIDPPDYLPPVFPAQSGRSESPVLRTTPSDRRAPAAPNLATLLAGVLFAFTLDFEALSRIALPIAANTLRVLDAEGVRLRDLPVLTGVSKEANAMCSGWLQRHGCAEQIRDPDAPRGQVLRLTARGRAAQASFLRNLAETEEDWRTSRGATVIDAVRAALEPLVGDGTLPTSPLAVGLEAPAGNWRASVRPPKTLPHYPMVLHRGAYPDGS